MSAAQKAPLINEQPSIERTTIDLCRNTNKARTSFVYGGTKSPIKKANKQMSLGRFTFMSRKPWWSSEVFKVCTDKGTCSKGNLFTIFGSRPPAWINCIKSNTYTVEKTCSEHARADSSLFLNQAVFDKSTSRTLHSSWTPRCAHCAKWRPRERERAN